MPTLSLFDCILFLMFCSYMYNYRLEEVYIVLTLGLQKGYSVITPPNLNIFG